MRKVILTTGGTGGHIFPALAVAEEIIRRFPKCSILFMGGQHGSEKELATRAGLEFVGLPVRGVLGRGIKALPALAGMSVAVIQAASHIGRFKPDVVVGFGGYAAFAGVTAAAMRRCPTAIHEQNSIPGVANRLLSRIARRVFLSMDDVTHSFPESKVRFTGNPVRARIVSAGFALPASSTRSERRLLVMGGSLGAKALNDMMLQSTPALQAAGISVWHQTGATDYERVAKAYAEAGLTDVRVEAFIDDVAAAYEWSDIVLCRAGATSIAELTAMGRPSVLVPFPFATHDHQLHNAAYLAAHDAAVLLEQKDITSTDVPMLLSSILHDNARLSRMSVASHQLGHPEAAAAVVDGLIDLLH